MKGPPAIEFRISLETKTSASSFQKRCSIPRTRNSSRPPSVVLIALLVSLLVSFFCVFHSPSSSRTDTSASVDSRTRRDAFFVSIVYAHNDFFWLLSTFFFFWHVHRCSYFQPVVAWRSPATHPSLTRGCGRIDKIVPTIGPQGAVIPARPAVASALHSTAYFSCLFLASSCYTKKRQQGRGGKTEAVQTRGQQKVAGKKRKMREIEKKGTTKEAHRHTWFLVVFRFSSRCSTPSFLSPKQHTLAQHSLHLLCLVIESQATAQPSSCPLPGPVDGQLHLGRTAMCSVLQYCSSTLSSYCSPSFC